MTKQEFKDMRQKNRIAASEARGSIGPQLGRLYNGAYTPTFDNSSIWALRNTIANEIAPEIRRRQMAWINS